MLAEKGLYAVPRVGGFASRVRVRCRPKERMPDVRIELDLELLVIRFERVRDEVDVAVADQHVLTPEHKQQRRTDLLDVFERRRLAARHEACDALPVENHGGVDAREGGRDERDRAAEPEAPRSDVTGIDERLFVQPVASRCDVGPGLLPLDRRRGRLAPRAALGCEGLGERRMSATKIVDREPDVTEAG